MLLTMVVLVAAGACVPPPATGPVLATGGDGGEARDPDAPAPDTEITWQAPRQELPWAPCPDVETEGTTCVGLRTTVSDPTGPLVVPVVRITSGATPADAPALVVVPGAEVERRGLIARIRNRWGAVLEQHPVVVVSHRATIGAAAACGTSVGVLDSVGQDGTDPTAPALRSRLARASQNCLDSLQGGELDRGAAGVASDVETLRKAWGVTAVALLGVGSGSRAVLRQATDHPETVALAALDSPAPASTSQEELTAAAVQGSESALRQWSRQCSRPECGPVGIDRAQAVGAAIRAAGAPGSPIPAVLLADLVRRSLAELSGSSEEAPSEGDKLLGDLATTGGGAPSTAVRRAAAELGSASGALVAECTDTAQRVPVARIAELAERNSHISEVFGRVLSAATARCSAWPTPEASPTRIRPELPVLVLASAADPTGGADPLAPRAGEITGAGARDVHTVAWQAPGSEVLSHSDCGREALRGFLADPAGSGSTGCPS